MKPLQQFLALYRYNAFASPWIWVFPVTFGVQPCMMLMMGSTMSSLTLLLGSVSMLLILPIMVAAFVFAGDKLLAGTPGLTPQTSQQIQTFAGDFLLTRAVDRPVVFQSRMALYWTLILVPLVAVIGLTLWRPELSLSVPLKAPSTASLYLAHLPGAVVSKTTEHSQVITSPYGRVVLAGVLALIGAASAAFAPILIYAILPLRWRKWIFWILFTGAVFLPVLMIGNAGKNVGGFERLVLWIMQNPVTGTVAVAVLAAVGFAFCAARDREVEYP